LQGLDWTRYRTAVLAVEDFEAFDAGVNTNPPASKIRTFLADQGYALASQLVFSFIYLDRQALVRNGRGFDLRGSQLSRLLEEQRLEHDPHQSAL
jgi:hypothetical protein